MNMKKAGHIVRWIHPHKIILKTSYTNKDHLKFAIHNSEEMDNKIRSMGKCQYEFE